MELLANSISKVLYFAQMDPETSKQYSDIFLRVLEIFIIFLVAALVFWCMSCYCLTQWEIWRNWWSSRIPSLFRRNGNRVCLFAFLLKKLLVFWIKKSFTSYNYKHYKFVICANSFALLWTYMNWQWVKKLSWKVQSWKRYQEKCALCEAYFESDEMN